MRGACLGVGIAELQGEDVQRLVIHGRRLRVLAELRVEVAQLQHDAGRVLVLQADGFFLDFQRPRVLALGVREATLSRKRIKSAQSIPT